MSLFFASLNSGSNGNCYYVGNQQDAILVDAGISCRETVKRMAKLGLSMERVRAVFISHEHSDHINGLEVLSKKYSLPVFITPRTLKASRLQLLQSQVHNFSAEETIRFGELQVSAFKKFHDASDPYSFTVSTANTTVGIFTDLGRVCDALLENFRKCDAAFLESNYDEDMLFNGNYPLHLKKRISDGFGHLSNSQALSVFLEHRSHHLQYLLLSHLSKNNNKPELALELFNKYAGSTQIAVASRFVESPVYEVCGKGSSQPLPKPAAKPLSVSQLSMF